jgi:hypothetical protein
MYSFTINVVRHSCYHTIIKIQTDLCHSFLKGYFYKMKVLFVRPDLRENRLCFLSALNQESVSKGKRLVSYLFLKLVMKSYRVYIVPCSFPYVVTWNYEKNNYPYLLGTLFSEELLQRRNVVSLWSCTESYPRYLLTTGRSPLLIIALGDSIVRLKLC